VPRICDTKIKNKWVVLAIEVTAGLPKLQSTRAVCALAKKCPSIGNRFSVVPGRKFGAPDELAVTIEKMTAVFDRACCPQRNLVRNGCPGFQESNFKLIRGPLAITGAPAEVLFGSVLRASHSIGASAANMVQRRITTC
jgi:hypothetical protein